MKSENQVPETTRRSSPVITLILMSLAIPIVSSVAAVSIQAWGMAAVSAMLFLIILPVAIADLRP